MEELKIVERFRLRVDVKKGRRTVEDIAKEYNVSPKEMAVALQLSKSETVVVEEPKTLINEQSISKKLKTRETIDSLLNKGLSDQKIADKLGIHRVTVTRYRLDHNLESGRDSKSVLISNLYKEGLNDRQISDKLKIHINTVYLWRKRNKKGAHKL